LQAGAATATSSLSGSSSSAESKIMLGLIEFVKLFAIKLP